MPNSSTFLTKVLDPNISHNVIIAGGLFPTNAYLVKLLAQARILIACDGTPIQSLKPYHRNPDYIIGDLDSLSIELKEQNAQIIKYRPNQNYNDLAKAIYFCYTELNLKEAVILGATGKREDHALANISLLMQYKDYIKLSIVSDYGLFRCYSGICTIVALPGQQISLFAIDNSTSISSKGLKWELNNFVISSWSSAVLNQALSTSFTLSTNKPIIVYQCFEVKEF